MARPKKAPKATTATNVVTLDKSKTGIVTIPGVRTQKVVTLAIGTAPLIMHKFAQKMREMILAKHMGEASAGREKKIPLDNFNAARHRLSDGSDGVTASGMKAAIVSGFSKDSGVPMTKAKGGIRVGADDPATNLVRIITPNPPIMREDIVRNDSGVVDIRHRPEYWPWALRVEIEFLPTLMSAAQVLQAFSMAGFTGGLGEWRPSSPQSRSGSFGTWRLPTEEEVEAFENGMLFADLRQPRKLKAVK